MCGIVGIFGDRNQALEERFEVGMNRTQHRGPDATTTFSDNFLLLGHHRLKIIDLSDSANQPFQDERFVLAFNGEIFNYLEIKKQFNFETRTNSDTEVLFCLLRRFHDDIPRALSYLNGMFAIAFYDRVEKSLMLVRDRLGVKPLVYTLQGETLFFSSESKGVLPFLNEFETNHKAVVNFLMNRTLFYGASTFFVGVHKIKAGTFHRFTWNGRLRRQVTTYWDIRKNKQDPIIDDALATDNFRALFQDSLSIRCRSDVPVAILLSGGLDSSAIASVAAQRFRNKEIRCITAVYPGDLDDEKALAAKVIEKHPNLNPLWMEIRKEEFITATLETIYAQESPIPDGSMVAHYLLMMRIHELGLKVVLTGQGGDEILGGYTHTFLPAAEADALRNFTSFRMSAKSLYHALPNRLKNRLRKINLERTSSQVFTIRKAFDLTDHYFSDEPTHGILTDYLISSIQYWSLPAFLHYDDKNSMAFGIETRGPFLDHRLVEFMISQPNHFKIRNGRSKWILRQALREDIPESILSRIDKQSFHAPIEKWSSSIPSDFMHDKSFQEAFSYINLQALSNNWEMKWKLFSLWGWYCHYMTPNHNRQDTRQSFSIPRGAYRSAES